MKTSRARWIEFERDEIAEAFARALKHRFAADPDLRDADAIGVHRNTLGKWERGEDLPGCTSLCSVLTSLGAWGLFLDELEGSDRHLSEAVDNAVSSLDRAIRSLAAHPSLRERRKADARLDDLHDRTGRLRRLLKAGTTTTTGDDG